MERLSAEDPRWIGDFRLLGRLGEGGMGRVYLARSNRGRTVAVKVVRNELARQSDFRRRFAQEITAARRVGGTWTAPVLGADTEADTPWVATGYIAGPSLAEVVDDQYGPLPTESVSALASGLTQALRDIHGAGLVHRDLKPSNVLITIDGPRVIDFGIARALDTAVESSGGLTRTGALVGSPGFMSPEQVRGQTVTPASDVFCLGAVLAYAATGRMPFGTSEAGVHSLLFRIAEEEPELSGLSGELHDMVAACLAKDPGERPGLETLIARTEADSGGTWLPGQVLAQLGRHAVQLLDSEDPDGTGELRTDAIASPAASATATPSAPSTPQPFTSPAPSTPPPGGPQLTGAYGPPVSPPFQGPQPWQQGPVQPNFQHGNGFPPSGPGTPPPAGHTPPPAAVRPPLSPRRMSQTITVLLSLLLLVDVIGLIMDVTIDNALVAKEGYFGSGSPRTIDGFSGMKGATIALETVSGLLGTTMIVVWLVWFWRVRVNADTFGPGRIRYGPGMAVGCWFIPLCNVFVPKQIINDIWSVSNPAVQQWFGYGPRPPARRGLVNGWWTMWLIYAFFGSMGMWQSWYEAADIQEAKETLALDFCTDFFGIPAAVLALVLVVKLTSFQDEKLTGR